MTVRLACLDDGKSDDHSDDPVRGRGRVCGKNRLERTYI
jgi:hypothetical protein